MQDRGRAMANRRWSFMIPLLAIGSGCTILLFGTLAVIGLPIGPEQYAMPVYFLVISFVLHAWQEQALIHRPNQFIHRFMAGLVLKMFLSLIVVLVAVLILPKPRVLPFVVGFVALYFAFLAFSTVRSTRLMRQIPGP